ncbi:phd finger domain-containing protein [Ophiocordyceps camponoti-floridani]|uniref:Phd finger domain-containing protein n=1 Tax=Ophiocordyceps camponoti-floridani TaxID=2030778 RepID=A0A8H4Q3M3_9HYPO|nr:phd finger domain-containing protein [Ophiocordyceps camponoti-floridani]
MPSRKRPIQAEEDVAGVINGDDASATLVRIRNMWQFANLCQWIYIFGKAAKIDESIDIEEIEADCLKPQQSLLVDLALAILKLVSSHRGLNHDILDDQLHKQYLMRAPNRAFGNGDNRSNKFCDLSVFQKIIVLQQLTQWAMAHPERLRDLVDEQKDTEQMSWRIEPYGWDKEDRTYFVLDDNRVYRLTGASPTQAPSKPKSKPAKSARAGRRNRTTETDMTDNGDDDGLGGKMWECVAVTLHDVQSLLENFAKTRDENEKILRRQLQTHLVPILEKMEEAQKRKQAQKERELLNMAKMANAKRSSRIAGKVEKRKLEEQAKEDELKERQSEVMKVREEQKRQRLERDRDFRMFSRQRRLQEREARRLQHKEELAQLSEDSRQASTGAGRMSERRLEAEIEKKKQSLEDLDREEEEWAFDCVCGLFGLVDDGTHCVACERCNVWQHSGCLGISEAEADRPGFQFVCDSCKRQDGRPFKMVKLKLNPSRSTASSRAERIPDTQSMERRAPCDDSSKPCSSAPLSGDGGSAANVPESTSLLAAPTASEPVSQLTPNPSEEARNAISAVDTEETSAAGNLLKQNGHGPLPRPTKEPQLDNGDSEAKAYGSPPTAVP